ncbi:hypothetical protein ZIOFF_011493 [Zingiber officinale]|uniref:Uncharacterized protein n=1 Tax=Zingiber officinale TaxID=94328 RepID=A0A8J5I5Z4_ZINOF|nr:hypothetical protein ZIOFF_011493 [Zingiber officinale]
MENLISLDLLPRPTNMQKTGSLMAQQTVTATAVVLKKHAVTCLMALPSSKKCKKVMISYGASGYLKKLSCNLKETAQEIGKREVEEILVTCTSYALL